MELISLIVLVIFAVVTLKSYENPQLPDKKELGVFEGGADPGALSELAALACLHGWAMEPRDKCSALFSISMPQELEQLKAWHAAGRTRGPLVASVIAEGFKTNSAVVFILARPEPAAEVVVFAIPQEELEAHYPKLREFLLKARAHPGVLPAPTTPTN